MTEQPPATPTSFIVPFVIAAGLFMEGLDSTILNTALPQIAVSLNTTPVALSVAITSYLLSLAVFIPLSGWIADRFGARRVFCTALLVFTLGSALCGFATSLGMMVAMRVLQGFGGAMMTPVGRLILARAFPKDRLIVAMNYMLTPALIGPILGPVIGGFLTTYVSWHWVFFINIPIGVIGVVLALRFISDIKMPRPAPLDILGFLIVGTGLALAQTSTELLGRHLVQGWVQLLIFIAAVVTLLAYGRHAKRAANPVLDLGLFRIRSFAVSVLVGGIARTGVMGTPFILPLLFQVGFGLDAFHSGVLVCLSTLGAFLMRFGMPRLLRTLGLKRVLSVNGILLAVLLAGFSLLHADTNDWILVPYLILFGLLRSMQMSSLGALSFDLPSELMSKATSIAAVGQRLAQSLAVGVAAIVLSLVAVPGQTLSVRDFTPVFLIIGLIELASVLGFRRLQAGDGEQLTGHRAAPSGP
jgi:EmrB/QacA subfamily drug resistance transporter